MPQLMRHGNARAMIDFYISAKLPFTLTCSNYTVMIESINSKEKYVNSLQSNRTFAAFAKIKSNLKDKPVPTIDREQLRYFVHDLKANARYETIYNIDLKAAYATILLKDGFITKDTYEYLKKLNKSERLASVGMLAAKKHSFIFRHGKAVDTSYFESPLSDFFYHAVKRTDEIMTTLKQICGNSYLFTWVDGIYYKDTAYTVEMMDYLNSIGFLSSYEVLTKMNVTVHAQKVKVNFIKDGKRKDFQLPSHTTQFKSIILNAMQSLNSQPKIKSI